MAITDKVGRIGAAFLAIVQTRLELAALEMEEESQRYIGYLMLALLSLVLCAIALALVALLVIVVFWDTHRIVAVAGMAVLFGAGATLAALRMRAALKAKPRLLAATVGELRNDINYIKNARHAHE